MAVGEFGKTTVRRAGVQSANQGDVSSGTGMLARGLQAFTNPLNQLAAVEGDKRIELAKRNAEKEGLSRGNLFDPKGNPIAPDNSDLDLNTVFGRNTAAAADKAYLSNLATSTRARAQVLAEQANGNSALYEELAQDYAETVMGNIPDALVPQAESELQTALGLARANVLIQEQRNVQDNQDATLVQGIETHKDNARTAALQGDGEVALASILKAQQAVQGRADAGFITQADADAKIREISIDGLSYAAEAGLKQELFQQGVLPYQRIFNANKMIEAIRTGPNEFRGMSITEGEKDVIVENLRAVVATEGSRIQQQESLILQQEAQIHRRNDRIALEREANGAPLSRAELDRQRERNEISLQTYLTLTDRDTKRKDAAIKETVDQAIFTYENAGMSHIAFMQSEAWKFAKPDQRRDMQRALLDRLQDEAEGRAELVMQHIELNGSLEPVAFMALVESLDPENLRSRVSGYITKHYGGDRLVMQSVANTMNRGGIPSGEKEVAAFRKMVGPEHFDIFSPGFSPAVAASVNQEIGYVDPKMGKQLAAQMLSENPSVVQTATETFSALCTATSTVKQDRMCGALKKSMGTEAFHHYEELTRNLTGSETPEQIVELAQAQRKRNELLRNDKSSRTRNLSAGAGEEGYALMIEKGLQGLGNEFDEGEGFIDGFEDFLARTVPGAHYLIQEALPSTKAAVAENPDLLEGVNLVPFQDEVRRRTEALLAEEAQYGNINIDQDKVNQLTRLAAVEASKDFTLELTTNRRFGQASDGSFDRGIIEEHEEIRLVRGSPVKALNKSSPFEWTAQSVRLEVQMQLQANGLQVPLDVGGNVQNWQEMNVELEQMRQSGQYRVLIQDFEGNRIPLVVRDAQGLSGVATIDLSNPNKTIHHDFYRYLVENAAVSDAVDFAGRLTDFVKQGLVTAQMEGFGPIPGLSERANQARWMREQMDKAGVPRSEQGDLLPPESRVIFQIHGDLE